MTDDRVEMPERWRSEVVALIPCYNAGPRVRPVAEATCRLLDKVIVVDDGSTDGAVEALRDLPLTILTFAENRGKGHALLAGFRAALADPETLAICVLDADGQHDPAEMPRLLEAWEKERAELVIGAREFSGGRIPWGSWLGNRVTRLVTALLLRRRLPDTQCGFRVLSRSFAQDVLDTVPGGRYEMEMEVVIKAIQEKRHMVSAPISTRYEPGNRSSHFHKGRDSLLIYARLLRCLRR
jgi:glycosyltransferase involved in cell wall biosynthesis